ncbi:MAG: hypothetical protein D4R68_07065 [Ignavibacteriales bacterium]|nr:MAG: hypothetical protein D4R68_07065 [Ignavibacteriales bacterium]
MKKKDFIKNRFFSIIIFLQLFTANQVFGQISNIVSSVKIGDAKEKLPLEISAELFSSENITNMNIAYKPFGENEFKKAEMLIAGNTASITLPAEVVIPPYLEYYLIINLRNGSTQTYPLDVSQGVSPLQISVSTVSEKEKEIIVLSPNPGEMLSGDELLISISFIKAPENIDVSKTKIFLNDTNVTSYELLTGDLIVLSGENLAGKIGYGAKLLTVEVYDKEGKLYHTLSRSFQTVSAEVAMTVSSKWKYYGNLKGESRNESYNSTSTWYNNISGEFNTTYNDFRFNAFAYLTSEEKNNLQPYNRYTAAFQAGDWLDLKAGDSYPIFPNLIMDGQRIRGFSGALNLGFINVQTAFGETTRGVEGNLLQTYPVGSVPLGSDIILIDKVKNIYGKVDLGTYKRQLLVVRPSFGSGENFQLGFSYLHAKDEVGSINYGARPQENIVIGTDIKFAFDDQNILLTSQAAISVQNKDISTGTITDAQIDSIFGKNSNLGMSPSDFKKIRNIVGSFITVNQYLGPWNPQEFSSLASETALSLNYLNNNLRASYVYRGNDYQSFGQTFIRTDVKGINIVDRIRMLDNKLFVSFGYESLKDNLQNTKVATTTYQTISASVSIFPRVDFPNITIGYNNYDNNNGLNVTNAQTSPFAVNDNTNRVLVQLSYDFTAGIRHNSSLSFTTSDRKDNTLAKMNANFSSGSLTLNSFWNQQLSSLFGIVFSSSEIQGVPFKYISFSFGGKYLMLENKLQLIATLCPSFGDFKRQTLEFTADYNVLANLNLMFQARLFRIPGASTNSIIGLVTRLAI